ncbi:hypothetical protein QYE76_030940 [Lolium multiflorum]|uniref:Uncharacterized protein n=1 Tax=Lolium multiflorum TaxID=4521 RepID=A0AAD8QR93_LOLMU|nr:hypothetical protein QYE76_030940 [Lolium multiflorum]
MTPTATAGGECDAAPGHSRNPPRHANPIREARQRGANCLVGVGPAHHVHVSPCSTPLRLNAASVLTGNITLRSLLSPSPASLFLRWRWLAGGCADSSRSWRWLQPRPPRGEGSAEPLIQLPTQDEHDAAPAPAPSAEEGVTRWHYITADVCHAYQILKKGGLKEENIVVFMYDDIAQDPQNPRRGESSSTILKAKMFTRDYTGDQVTTNNFFAVLMGNKTAVTGGSRKVINSKQNDHIFIYYADHGGAGSLGAYSHINVIYVEACESGSMFEGIMPQDLNIYVTTAANAEESSWGTYCPGWNPPPPHEYLTCLGDVYSVSWMEDSETHNLKKEAIKDQYESVKREPQAQIA